MGPGICGSPYVHERACFFTDRSVVKVSVVNYGVVGVCMYGLLRTEYGVSTDTYHTTVEYVYNTCIVLIRMFHSLVLPKIHRAIEPSCHPSTQVCM